MRTREPEPLEQIDYGRDYQSRRVRKYSPSAASSVIFNENTKQWFIGVLMAMSIIVNVVLYLQFAQTEREARMLEYYTMELDGKLMASGVIDYNESWSARKKAKEN